MIWHVDGTGGTMARNGKRYFGSLRTLPSGRVQARYTGPDGVTYKAPVPFDSPQYAEAFLARTHAHIQAERWKPPSANKVADLPSSFSTYAAAWLAGRDLADRTRDDYAQILRDHINPVFGDLPVAAITPAAVREWHAKLRTQTGPTMR